MIKISFSCIEINRVINTSQDILWDLITDTNRWIEWGPSVTDVDCPVQYIKLGSKGRIRTTVGLWLPFLITEYEENRFWAWRVSGIRATGHHIEPINQNQCQLSFEVPMLAAPYVSICKIALDRIARIVEN